MNGNQPRWSGLGTHCPFCGQEGADRGGQVVCVTPHCYWETEPLDEAPGSVAALRAEIEPAPRIQGDAVSDQTAECTECHRKFDPNWRSIAAGAKRPLSTECSWDCEHKRSMRLGNEYAKARKKRLAEMEAAGELLDEPVRCKADLLAPYHGELRCSTMTRYVNGLCGIHQPGRTKRLRTEETTQLLKDRLTAVLDELHGVELEIQVLRGKAQPLRVERDALRRRLR